MPQQIHVTLRTASSSLTDLRSAHFPPFLCSVGPLIGRYCGTKIPPEIQSSTGLLSLSFHTDMAVAKDGFSARYNMTRREISDSKYCFWRLSVSFSDHVSCLSQQLKSKHYDSKHYSVCLSPYQPNWTTLGQWCLFGGGTICLVDQWQTGVFNLFEMSIFAILFDCTSGAEITLRCMTLHVQCIWFP